MMTVTIHAATPLPGNTDQGNQGGCDNDFVDERIEDSAEFGTCLNLRAPPSVDKVRAGSNYEVIIAA